MHKQLEDYLNQLRSALTELPENERDAEVEETRQHLLALIEQKVEAGEPVEAAVAGAIQQFGAPQTTGKELRKAWRRGQGVRSGRWIAALHCAVAVGVVFQLLTGVFQTSVAYQIGYYPMNTLFQGNSVQTGWDFLWQLALSLFAAASLSAPQKLRLPFLGVLAVMGIMNVATALPPGQVLTPFALNYYLFSQFLCFVLSSVGVWLEIKRSGCPVEFGRKQAR